MPSCSLIRLTLDELARLHAGMPVTATQLAAWLDPEGADVPGPAGADTAERVFDLEDAVSGVHLLLTGTTDRGAGPLGFLADDGRALDAASVAALADTIESMSARDVRQRLASPALAAVPPFAERPLTDDDKEWLLAVLQGLMVFVRRAADDGAPLLVVRY